MERVRGVVVNASCCSHAELDGAEALDAGDPEELGGLVGDLCRRFPQFRVIGGRCGTDLRHLQRIAERARPAAAA